MDDIKAIDIQNRIFSVRAEPYFRQMHETYESRILSETTFKGFTAKMELKTEEEKLKAMMERHAGSVPKMLQEMDEVGVEMIFVDQFRLWSYREHRVPVMVTLEAMGEVAGTFRTAYLRRNLEHDFRERFRLPI